MSNPKKKKARLTFGKGSSALTHMDEFMEEHAGEIEELNRRFGKADKAELSDGRKANTVNAPTTVPVQKAA